jgi:hypothetical protein
VNYGSNKLVVKRITYGDVFFNVGVHVVTLVNAVVSSHAKLATIEILLGLIAWSRAGEARLSAPLMRQSNPLKLQ